ncbi:hypothetical protein PR001_g21342 [Phytophthora rubi]|uniref:Uncharacterized protein n=1 Tax=Phytophthora rubi TaxID=129364 RepID=A0A6A3J9N2_9STRA|nr:hypothetical protein PR001_g21342 [Phytophthora rubi]
MPSPSPWPISATGKRKRLDMEDELTSFLAPTPTKRKGSSDVLRKGQWANTEERLARLLIEAFEDGYLPISTGIRLRGAAAMRPAWSTLKRLGVPVALLPAQPSSRNF